MTCDVLHGLAKCRCGDGGKYLRELCVSSFREQRMRMEKGLLNESKVNHKKPYEKLFSAMENPSGTRNACSQFSQCSVTFGVKKSRGITGG